MSRSSGVKWRTRAVPTSVSHEEKRMMDFGTYQTLKIGIHRELLTRVDLEKSRRKTTKRRSARYTR